jgi:hypothetical protein
VNSLAHFDTVEIGLAATLKVRVGELPDVLLNLSRIVINMFNLVSQDRYEELRNALTLEKPYLLSCRTKLEKLE